MTLLSILNILLGIAAGGLAGITIGRWYTKKLTRPYGNQNWRWVEGWATPEIEVRHFKIMLWQDFDEILPNGDIKTTRCLADPLCGRRVTQLDAPRVRIHPPQYPPWLDCIPRHPNSTDVDASRTACAAPHTSGVRPSIMKRNRRKPNPDLAADLMAAFMALCLVGSLTLTTLFIYTWCRPTVSSLRSPVSRLSQPQEVR